jgi:triphosphoribosyl-dephospho-CoA synthase
MSESTRTIGKLAQLACEWEVLARKAGNVCPGREFPDLTVDDFLKSAAAIAPIMEQAPHQALGVTILRAMEATRKVVSTNTNLGIVLLLAPLASVPLEEPLMPALSRVLAQTTVEDSRKAYQAIRLANPGGLGKVDAQDVAEQPTLPLRAVMELAANRDKIAMQYVEEYDWVINSMAPFFVERFSFHGNLEQAIVDLQLCTLCQWIDSLVERKLGILEAGQVTRHAGKVHDAFLNPTQSRQLFLAFDAWLRSENHARNPGTTADLIVAALFVALREQQISPNAPFTWPDHPFGA